MSDQFAWVVGLEVRHIAALEAVASEGSFRRAAEKLGYVQSAISQQIAALERVVGRRVVERRPGGGRVELTPAGELVLLHGQAVLTRLKAAQADVAALDEDRSQQLRVGLTQSIGVSILPELLRRFRRDWPHVLVVPVESTTDLSPYEAVECGQLDLSFVDLPTPSGPFEAFELITDPYVLVVRRDSELAGRGTVTLRDLAGQPLVGHTECRGLSRIETQLRARGHEPEVVLRSEVNATIQAAARAGVGAAILPALAVDPSDRLVSTHELNQLPPRLLGVIRHRDRHHSEAAQAFVEIAQTVCAGVVRQRTLVPYRNQSG